MAYTFSNLTGLKTTDESIKAWANQGTVPSALILTEAEAWIYNRLRASEMRESYAWSAAIGASGFALPSDFIQPLKLTVDGMGGEGLTYVHEDLFWMRHTDPDGALYTSPYPSAWTIMDDANVMFDIKLSEARAGDLWYYRRLPALSVSNETNFLTNRFPTLLRRTCLMFAFEWLKDTEQMDRQIALAEQALAEANAYHDNQRRGGEY